MCVCVRARALLATYTPHKYMQYTCTRIAALLSCHLQAIGIIQFTECNFSSFCTYVHANTNVCSKHTTTTHLYI